MKNKPVLTPAQLADETRRCAEYAYHFADAMTDQYGHDHPDTLTAWEDFDRFNEADGAIARIVEDRAVRAAGLQVTA